MKEQCSNCKYAKEHLYGFWCVHEQGYVVEIDVCLSYQKMEGKE